MEHEWGWVWTTHTFLFTPVFFSLPYSPWHPCRLSVSSVVAVLGSECSSLRCLLPLPWLSPLSLVSFLKCCLLYLEILAWLFQKQALNALPRLLLPPPSPGVPNFISFCLPSKLFIEVPICPTVSFSCLFSVSQPSLLRPRHQSYLSWDLMVTPRSWLPDTLSLCRCYAFNKALLGLCSLLRKWPWLECVLHRLLFEHIH